MLSASKTERKNERAEQSVRNERSERVDRVAISEVDEWTGTQNGGTLIQGARSRTKDLKRLGVNWTCYVCIA
jgi:hypothetical protein